MKTLLTNLTAPPQQRSNHASQQLRNAKQGKDQSLTAFAAYITNTAQGTQISNYNKRMFLRTGMCPKYAQPCREVSNIPRSTPCSKLTSKLRRTSA
jgi:hypothetical protein